MKNFPIAVPVPALRYDLYMDEVLTDSDLLTTAKELQVQLTEILKRGGLTLHKWCSNNSELTVDNNGYPFSNEEDTTTVGVLWKLKKDCFGFKLNLKNNTIIMKRHILFTIARLFDSVGLVQ